MKCQSSSALSMTPRCNVSHLPPPPLSMTSRQGTPLSSGSHPEEMTGISAFLWEAYSAMVTVVHL